MGKRISELTAISGGTFATTDLFEISVDAGSGTFVSRKITGQEMINSIGADNIGNANLTINVSGTRKLIMGGALSTDIFAIRNSSDSANILSVNGVNCVWSNGQGLVSTNTAFGEEAFNPSTTGINNTAFGNRALEDLTSANYNTAVGFRALGDTTTSGKNTAVGWQSLVNCTGQQNTAVGYGNNSTSGRDNTMIGHQASNTLTGDYNTFLGSRAGYNVTSGDWNVVISPYNLAGTGITTGNRNTIVGLFTGLSSSLSNHVLIGDNNGNQAFKRDNDDNIVLGGESALATTATNGFNYVRGGAGIPTGTPATSFTGHVPMYADTTNNKLYIYSGGSWVALN